MLFGNGLQKGKHLSNGVGNVLQEGEWSCDRLEMKL
jgi:hypothetical protein